MRDRACVDFLKQILPELGLRWPGYRKVHGTVCKRIRRRMRALGLGDLEAYRRRVLADPGERAELDAMCRIPISRFGRDRAIFDALIARALAMPRASGAIRCWSCGCASGEEPYTLQILWELQAADVAQLEIVATDADPHMLERAKVGCYPRGSLKELSADEVGRAFAPAGDRFCVRPEFRSDIGFLRQDVRTEMPEGCFDLVLCRNLVFTYFDSSLQRRLLPEFGTKLAPSGILVLGRQEELPEIPSLFERLSPELPIWRNASDQGAAWQRGQ